MSCWGTGRRTYAPLLPEGHDSRERHHCGPGKYIGMTPLDIVAKFKDSSTFPWYRLPEALRRRRFEELWQLAHRAGHRQALETVRLLTDAAFDRGAGAGAGGRGGAAVLVAAGGNGTSAGANMVSDGR